MSGLLDTVGMFDLAAALPEQVAAAAALGADVEGLPAHDDVEQVVVLGMGGSGVAGDVLAAIAGPFMPVPVIVAKGYEAPASVGPGTLCFAVSYSGDTEETVEAAQAAATAGARMVVLSTGGALGALARSWGAPHIVLPECPMPRAGVGSVSIPPLIVLERVGLFPGATQYVADAVEQLTRRRDKLIVDGGPAQRIAREIGRTMPIAYGGDALGAVAAYRFKCQVNENAKAPAFAAALPEMAHNEICGWGQHGDVTRQVMTVVRLRHAFEHPQVTRRFDLTYDILDEVVHAIVDIEAEGEGALAQLFDLVIQGDFVSLHMAAEAGVDPGPIPVLVDLKAALAT
ncbi:MAG: SIS domain-containing protein [Acidimicrobiales bacterium]